MSVSSNFPQFKKKVTDAGLEARDCGNLHWQIIGGKLLVNYYPHSKRGPVVYVAGTTEGFFGSDEKAIEAAQRIPEKLEKESRKNPSHYKRHKKRMLKKNPFCFWCKKQVDSKTATIDHRVPLHKGGLNHSNNYVLACEPCNQAKGHQIWQQGSKEK